MNTPGGRNLLGRLDNGHDSLPSTPWTIALIVSALLLCVAALVVAILICVYFKDGAIAMVCLTFVACLLLGFISISEWCESGNLTASSVVLMYSMWLTYEAVSALPNTSTKLLPGWFSLTVCGVSLASFALYSRTAKEEQQAAAQARDVDVETSREGNGAASTEDHGDSDIDTFQFMKQCLIHASAAVYIASVWAPSRNWGTYTARVIALVASLALYGWILIAPKVLKNRDFS